jgi:hypothetical protein
MRLFLKMSESKHRPKYRGKQNAMPKSTSMSNKIEGTSMKHSGMKMGKSGLGKRY